MPDAGQNPGAIKIPLQMRAGDKKLVIGKIQLIYLGLIYPFLPEYTSLFYNYM